MYDQESGCRKMNVVEPAKQRISDILIGTREVLIEAQSVLSDTAAIVFGPVPAAEEKRSSPMCIEESVRDINDRAQEILRIASKLRGSV